MLFDEGIVVGVCIGCYELMFLVDMGIKVGEIFFVFWWEELELVLRVGKVVNFF